MVTGTRKRNPLIYIFFLNLHSDVYQKFLRTQRGRAMINITLQIRQSCQINRRYAFGSKNTFVMI